MRIHEAYIEQPNLQMLRMQSNPNVPNPQTRPRILQDSFTHQFDDSETEEVGAIESENEPGEGDHRKSPKRKPTQFSYEAGLVEEPVLPEDAATTGHLINVVG